MHNVVRSMIGMALAASVASCEGGTQFAVKYAPEFAPGRKSVAIFGVFQAGRMSQDAWMPLSGRVSGVLGRPSSSCPVAFSDALKNADAELYEKLDEEVAQNGIADDIIDLVAGKTDAEVIMTVSMHGRIDRGKTPSVGDDPTVSGARTAAMPGQRSRAEAGAARRRHRGGGTTMAWHGLELSASLYSVKLKRSVGRIAMRYSGSNIDEAVTLFAQKIGAELPGSTCREWTFAKPQ
ncbi:Hypothetical protein A7982_03214 [Minicystis rosea]|nr:Hypothetical protein A7982_03214 [Minicystis rosea]